MKLTSKFTFLFVVILLSPLIYYIVFCAEQSRMQNQILEIEKKEMTVGFEKIESFIADLQIKESNGESITGKIFYKLKPFIKMKTVLEYGNGEKIIKYDNGNSQITYLPTENIAFKERVSDNTVENSLGKFFNKVKLGTGRAYKKNSLCYYEIDLPIPTESMMTEEIAITMRGCLNKNLGYVEKIVFINRNGKELETQEFKNYQLNIPIDDKEFEFIPPKGCKIMFREEVIPSQKNHNSGQ